MREPLWLELARKELGVKEVPGAQHNQTIIGYWRDGNVKGVVAKTDEIAWCAAFCNAMLERSNVKGTQAANAKSFLKWGSVLEVPALGCLVVLNRPGGETWQGHVGFCVGVDSQSIYMLGGNQGNAVSIAKFSKARLAGYRWPMSAALQPEWRALGVVETTDSNPSDR